MPHWPPRTRISARWASSVVAFNCDSVSIFFRYRVSCSAITFDGSGVAFHTRALKSIPPETI